MLAQKFMNHRSFSNPKYLDITLEMNWCCFYDGQLLDELAASCTKLVKHRHKPDTTNQSLKKDIKSKV